MKGGERLDVVQCRNVGMDSLEYEKMEVYDYSTHFLVVSTDA